MNDYHNPEQRAEARNVLGKENLPQPAEQRAGTLREASHVITMLSRMFGHKTPDVFVESPQQGNVVNMSEYRQREIIADEAAVNRAITPESVNTTNTNDPIEAARQSVEQARERDAA